MTRDSQIFVGFLAVFAVTNGILLGGGYLDVSWESFGVILAAGMTISLYSFLYRDNPMFKLAEHIFVGVAAAYIFGINWYQSLYRDVVVPLFGIDGDTSTLTQRLLLVIPSLLGLLILTRLSSKISWLSRISFAFVVGVGAGFTIPRYISAFVLSQIGPTMQPITLDMDGLNLVLILIGVVSVLVYFFFSVEHTGVVGGISRVGIWFLMVSFGASFGYTIMARLSLLIGRVRFLLDDWLHVM
ncbi:MAG: hypothetical protein HN712_17335 [Gemmatimonadetes bacterium]|jgi:hypothetical protein|nr:hypothetical protein [Gemmatimonadota bacterium]MBT6147529.1 hypothetical protein [Gemmatimonadota bacterium]MBT7862083.1 hypothetical protein [Gemmatimonadota bacterium]